MRNRFFDSLFELAKKDKRIVIITADMGFNLLERFQKEIPNQIVNGGISEANCMSMAAGMALAGRKVYVYSIAPFVTYRSFEQTRVDVCYHNADVKIIGMGAGLDYGQSGSSHEATEDIAIMRSLPRMKVVCPIDPLEAGELPKTLLKDCGPIYIRIGRGKEPEIYDKKPEIVIGEANKIICARGKEKISIFCTGNISHEAYLAAKSLVEKGHPIELIAMSWIKPLDEKALLSAMRESKLIVTVEEHTEIGGLYSAVCEFLTKKDSKVKIRSISLPDAFQKEIGKSEYLREKNGLDAKSIERRIEKWNSEMI